MPETKPEATREAFEKWGNAKGAHIERSWNGEFYENRLVESAWQGFQAGAESSADALEQAREALRKYGRHLPGCGRNDPFDTFHLPCSCGFEAALASTRNKGNQS